MACSCFTLNKYLTPICTEIHQTLNFINAFYFSLVCVQCHKTTTTTTSEETKLRTSSHSIRHQWLWKLDTCRNQSREQLSGEEHHADTNISQSNQQEAPGAYRSRKKQQIRSTINFTTEWKLHELRAKRARTTHTTTTTWIWRSGVDMFLLFTGERWPDITPSPGAFQTAGTARTELCSNYMIHTVNNSRGDGRCEDQKVKVEKTHSNPDKQSEYFWACTFFLVHTNSK